MRRRLHVVDDIRMPVRDAFANGWSQRAIRLIRSRAEEWRVNPARVGIMGFSAGGEVAALAATRFDAGKPDAADPIDRLSSRPDFDALIYPGIRANNYTIPKDTPVTFMLCADNDRGPSNAIAGLYPMLKAAGIQTEVHVYATGGNREAAKRAGINTDRVRITNFVLTSVQGYWIIWLFECDTPSELDRIMKTAISFAPLRQVAGPGGL